MEFTLLITEELFSTLLHKIKQKGQSAPVKLQKKENKMGFTVSTLVSESAAKIQYKHNAAVTAWTPIYVSGLGPIVPVVNAEANQLCVYYRFGVFKFTVANSIEIAIGDAVYYNSVSGVVQKAIPDNGFYLGKAVSSGTGNPTGTVSVEVSLNDNPPIDSNFESDNIITTGNVSCGNVVAGGNVAATGNVVAGGNVAATGNVVAGGKIVSTSSQVIGKAEVKTFDAAGADVELTGAGVLGGIIKVTPSADIDITLPDADDLLELIPGAVVGTCVTFSVINCATADHELTIEVPSSITNGGADTQLVVDVASSATFKIVFTDVTTDSAEATLYRV
jgi:septum formation inhibitor MinC